MTALPGIADEAWTASRGGSDPLVHVVVRRANVVILIDAISDGSVQHAAELGILQHGARLAASDVVAELARRH